jgi:hypothetical protein
VADQGKVRVLPARHAPEVDALMLRPRNGAIVEDCFECDIGIAVRTTKCRFQGRWFAIVYVLRRSLQRFERLITRELCLEQPEPCGTRRTKINLIFAASRRGYGENGAIEAEIDCNASGPAAEN